MIWLKDEWPWQILKTEYLMKTEHWKTQLTMTNMKVLDLIRYDWRLNMKEDWYELDKYERLNPLKQTEEWRRSTERLNLKDWNTRRQDNWIVPGVGSTISFDWGGQNESPCIGTRAPGPEMHNSGFFPTLTRNKKPTPAQSMVTMDNLLAKEFLEEASRSWWEVPLLLLLV